VSNWNIHKLDATSAPTAIGRAVRDYMKGLTAKEKRDAAKSLEVKCTYLQSYIDKAQVETTLDTLIARRSA
jgi:hypothetical protein